MRLIACLAANRLASQEGLCTMVPSSCAACPTTSITSQKNYITETSVSEPHISPVKVRLWFDISLTMHHIIDLFQVTN